MKLLETNQVQSILLELMKKVHLFLEEKNIPYYMIGGNALGAIRHGGFIPWDDDIDIGMFRGDYEKFLEVCGEFDSSYDIVNYRNSKNCDFVLTRIYFPNTYIDNPTVKDTKLDKRLYFDIFPIDNVPDDNSELSKFEEKIKGKKTLITRIDTRNYNNPLHIIVAKRIFSFIVSPFRNLILKKTEGLMRTYENDNTSRVCSLCSQYSFKKQVMPKSYYGTPTLYKFEDEMFYAPENLDSYLTTLYGSNYMEVPPENKRRKGYNIYSLED